MTHHAFCLVPWEEMQLKQPHEKIGHRLRGCVRHIVVVGGVDENLPLEALRI
jgi:hypothetical protein